MNKYKNNINLVFPESFFATAQVPTATYTPAVCFIVAK